MFVSRSIGVQRYTTVGGALSHSGSHQWIHGNAPNSVQSKEKPSRVELFEASLFEFKKSTIRNTRDINRNVVLSTKKLKKESLLCLSPIYFSRKPMSRAKG